MNALHTRHCQTQVARLSDEAAAAHLAQLSDWKIEDGSRIEKVYSFKNYYGTIAFVNLVAWISHRENHHPDLRVGFNKCTVTYTTHSAGGLSENDFICAARIDAALTA